MLDSAWVGMVLGRVHLDLAGNLARLRPRERSAAASIGETNLVASRARRKLARVCRCERLATASIGETCS